LPTPWIAAKAHVHGPLSTEALKPNWVRSRVAVCSARARRSRCGSDRREAHIGAGRDAHAETGDAANVWRRSPTKSPTALVLAEMP